MAHRNPEDKRAYDAAYRQANKDKRREQHAAQHAAMTPEQRERKRAYNKAWRDANREHVRAVNAAWTTANPEKVREVRQRWRAAPGRREEITTRWWRSQIVKLYGITPDDYDRLLMEQGGVCAVCKRPPADKQRLCVDHCHTTNKVRGLLCSKCNTGLGQFDESPGSLLSAIAYLAAH